MLFRHGMVITTTVIHCESNFPEVEAVDIKVEEAAAIVEVVVAVATEVLVEEVVIIIATAAEAEEEVVRDLLQDDQNTDV